MMRLPTVSYLYTAANRWIRGNPPMADIFYFCFLPLLPGTPKFTGVIKDVNGRGYFSHSDVIPEEGKSRERPISKNNLFR